MRSGALRDSSELLRRQRVGSRRSLPFPSQPPPPLLLPDRQRAVAPPRAVSVVRAGRRVARWPARPPRPPARARAGAARAPPVAAAPPLPPVRARTPPPMALARRGARAAPAAVGGGAAAARVLVVGDEGVGKTAFVETIATGGGGGGHAVALSDLTRTVGASVRCVAIGGNDAAVAAESGDAPAIIELWDVGGDRSRAQLRKTFYERVAGVVYVWDAKVRGAPQRLTIGLRHQACTCVVLTRAYTIIGPPLGVGSVRELAAHYANGRPTSRATPPSTAAAPCTHQRRLPITVATCTSMRMRASSSRCWRATWAVAGARNDAADADLLGSPLCMHKAAPPPARALARTCD